MSILIKQLIDNFERNNDVTPHPLLEGVKTSSKKVKTPTDAINLINELEPSLLATRADEELIIEIALLLEKTRESIKLFDIWLCVYLAFPNNLMAARMCMRWYNRTSDVDAGLQLLLQENPERESDIGQAEITLFGYSELELFSDIDALMRIVLPKYPKAVKIRSRYIQTLVKQMRYLEALDVAKESGDTIKWGPSIQKTLAEIESKKSLSRKVKVVCDKALGDIVSLFRERNIERSAGIAGAIGRVCFFTGQLGAGGAERQMTRIASLMQTQHNKEKDELGYAYCEAPLVCVKHVNKHTNADFFLPVLQSAGVQTEVLKDKKEPLIEDLIEDSVIRELLHAVTPSLLSYLLKLVALFKKEKIEAAYLWQDGGVLIGVVAALLANVPTIVLNFRGMPPILRPELMRNEIPHLYQQLINIPGIVFSSNSKIASKAYSDWLGFDVKRFTVIQNAVPVQQQLGSVKDNLIWKDIKSKTKTKTKTVLGVFRFDDNKRPDYWVEIAAEYSKKHPDTRFIIVGKGKMQQQCMDLITTLGVEDSVFLAGPSLSVGYWYKKADLVMHLARMEGLPNVLIESHIAGCPVLTTPAGGTEEVVEHGQTGHILSCAHSPAKEEIFHALEDMLSNVKRLKDMGKVANSICEPRHNENEILKLTLKMFDKNLSFAQ